MKATLPILSAAVVAACLTTGCIHTHETVVRDEPRVSVSFENEAAGRVFYETLSRMPGSGSRRENSTSVEIPIVFEHSIKTVRGPNTAFNEAVSRADTNRDGKITETEANIFAGQVKQ